MNFLKTSHAAPRPTQEPWLDYRTVWRWHFYAGLFCIPFVIWLSITGSIYLFKPQIEGWLDRPYDNLKIAGAPATPETQARVAVRAVPGSSLHYYELPETASSATRVIVGKGTEEYRVYLHPQTSAILKIVNEDRRPMRVIFRLHGELMAGDWGSRLVELAASWTIVMIVTGLYLWWPRQAESIAGVLTIRFRHGRRILWRDLHAVTGVWVSMFALFLLLTGLPWAKGWGGYLKSIRSVGRSHLVHEDWTTGHSSEISSRIGMNSGSDVKTFMEHAEHRGHEMRGPMPEPSYTPLNRLVPTLASLNLAAPVLVMPPMAQSRAWTAKSDAQNRTLRTVITFDPTTYAILRREDFDQRPLLDRVVGIGVAAHEGQLFGVPNQVLGLFTAMGLSLISLSAVVLWWRRRHVGVLGAPKSTANTRVSFGFTAILLGFAVFLPMLGLSMILVIFMERSILCRIPSVARWLGLPEFVVKES